MNVLSLLKKEPAVALGVVCGAAIWALTRFLGVAPDTAQQVIYGVVPVLFSLVTRQFVRPAVNVVSGTESTLGSLVDAVRHPSVIGDLLPLVKKELPNLLADVAAQKATPAAAPSVNQNNVPVTTTSPSEPQGGNINSVASAPLIPPDPAA